MKNKNIKYYNIISTMEGFARDPYFTSCPAIMSYSPFTDYRMSSTREQYNRTINGMVDENEWRVFMQKNGSKLAKSEFDYLKKNFYCDPRKNVCVHKYHTRQTPGSQYTELRAYNAARKGKMRSPCEDFEDYPLYK